MLQKNFKNQRHKKNQILIIHLNFINEIALKKVHQKIEIAFKFKWKILYKLSGPKFEITFNFKSEIPSIEIGFNFTWKILYKLIGPRKKINSEFPSNLIWDSLKSCINWSDSKKNYKRIPFKFDLGSFYREILCVFLQKNSLKNFTGKSFYFFSTFRLILKKSYQEGVFEFFNPDPQLVQSFKPIRNLSGQFFYIYI